MMEDAVYTEANPLKFEDQEMYLIEGTLSELQTARTTINLLAQIDSDVRAKSVVAGAAAVLSGMHGIVANSAAIALYDGEEAYHFAALLDDRVICGTFQHANHIKDEDRVKAVVSRRGEALFVHSIMNAKSQEFYMPLNEFAGSAIGLWKHCMKVAWTGSILMWIVFSAAYYLTGVLSFPNLSDTERLLLCFMLIAFPPALMFPFEYWTYRSMGGRSRNEDGKDSYAGVIFRIFGFPRPDKIDLIKDSDLSMGTGGGWYAAWRVDKLLAKVKA